MMMRTWMVLALLAVGAAAQEAKLAWKSGPPVDYEAQKVALAPEPPKGLAEGTGAPFSMWSLHVESPGGKPEGQVLIRYVMSNHG